MKGEQKIARLFLMWKYVLNLAIWDHKQDRTWLAEAVDTRTRPAIPIPYNPALFQHKKHPRATPITEVLKKAEKYQKLLEKGVVSSRAELARREGLSKARITQILYLTKLHSEIKEYFTSLTDQNLAQHFSEEKVRKIARTEREGQPKEFEKLKKHARKMSTNIFK